MAYNKKNYLKKCEHALRVTSLHYEPGRHDRCYRWVWQKYIRDTFHVEYPTYMKWLRDIKQARGSSDSEQLSLFD